MGGTHRKFDEARTCGEFQKYGCPGRQTDRHTVIQIYATVPHAFAYSEIFDTLVQQFFYGIYKDPVFQMLLSQLVRSSAITEGPRGELHNLTIVTTRA